MSWNSGKNKLWVWTRGILLLLISSLVALLEMWGAEFSRLLPKADAIQWVYVVLSFGVVVVIYLWGVGRWSRFGPPSGKKRGTTSAAPTTATGNGVN